MAGSAASHPTSSGNTATRMPILERHLQSYELHFGVAPHGGGQNAPAPLRLRIRRHWPVWISGGGDGATAGITSASGARSYPGHPTFQGQWTPGGLPIFRDSQTHAPWYGELGDLIDGHWATDPTAIRAGGGGDDGLDAAWFARYMAQLAQGNIPAATGKETHFFLYSGRRGAGAVDDTSVLRIVTDKDAIVKMYPWRYGEVPMPREECIIRMPWKYIRTEDLVES
jgi:hypothetical protein